MQTKKMSLTETLTSVGVGYIVALISQILIFPVFDIRSYQGQCFNRVILHSDFYYKELFSKTLFCKKVINILLTFRNGRLL